MDKWEELEGKELTPGQALDALLDGQAVEFKSTGLLELGFLFGPEKIFDDNGIFEFFSHAINNNVYLAAKPKRRVNISEIADIIKRGGEVSPPVGSNLVFNRIENGVFITKNGGVLPSLEEKHLVEDWIVEKEPNEYVISWDNASNCARWFAVDRDGDGYFYSDKPKLNKKGWVPERRSFLDQYAGEFPSHNWENSLTKRP